MRRGARCSSTAPACGTLHWPLHFLSREPLTYQWIVVVFDAGSPRPKLCTLMPDGMRLAARVLAPRLPPAPRAADGGVCHYRWLHAGQGAAGAGGGEGVCVARAGQGSRMRGRGAWREQPLVWAQEVAQGKSARPCARGGPAGSRKDACLDAGAAAAAGARQPRAHRATTVEPGLAGAVAAATRPGCPASPASPRPHLLHKKTLLPPAAPQRSPTWCAPTAPRGCLRPRLSSSRGRWWCTRAPAT